MGYIAIGQSFARTAAESNVALALRLAPHNGRIMALRAAQMSGLEATVADRREAGRLARAALQREPTAVLAASTLGLIRQLRGDVNGARRLFAYAERLSRRDLQTQIWAIEDAVGRGDVAAALWHYDTALRTNPKSEQLLFPVLTAASASPFVREGLVRLLAERPPWSDTFLRHVAANGSDHRASMNLFLTLRRAGISVPEDAGSATINALLADGSVNDAWRYYRTLDPGAAADRSRDPRFTAAPQAPSVFDWTPISDAGIVTAIRGNQNGRIFDFSAQTGVGGPLLQQVQLLPPGTYRLAGHAGRMDVMEGKPPFWTLNCRADGRVLGRLVLSGLTQRGGDFGGMFTVPRDCPVQILMLVAEPSTAVAGVAGQIDRVQLSPAS